MLRLAYTATDMYEVTLYIYLRVCVFVCSGELIHVDCGISTDFWEVAEWCAIRTPISCFIAVHTNHPIISRSAYFSCFAFVFVVRERNSSTTINHDCEYIYIAVTTLPHFQRHNTTILLLRVENLLCSVTFVHSAFKKKIRRMKCVIVEI